MRECILKTVSPHHYENELEGAWRYSFAFHLSSKSLLVFNGLIVIWAQPAVRLSHCQRWNVFVRNACPCNVCNMPNMPACLVPCLCPGLASALSTSCACAKPTQAYAYARVSPVPRPALIPPALCWDPCPVLCPSAVTRAQATNPGPAKASLLDGSFSGLDIQDFF